jgi:putative transposase
MELIHVVTRGLDKRKIFRDEQDYFRFIHDLFEFNDKESVNTTFYIFNKLYKSYDVRRRKIKFNEKKRIRKLLVKIHAFCLMPNHYHLLLTPIIENGVVLFMKKLNGGYAKYFNEKYKRKGSLFEGRYKKVIVKNESHFIHLTYYIHLNPLDLINPEWRKREIKNYSKAVKFLYSYRWSSHLDYLGEKNFPSVTQREFLLDFFDGPKEYELGIKNWLKTLDLKNLYDIFLEE